jgi:hypothetical protein
MSLLVLKNCALGIFFPPPRNLDLLLEAAFPLRNGCKVGRLYLQVFMSYMAECSSSQNMGAGATLDCSTAISWPMCALGHGDSGKAERSFPKNRTAFQDDPGSRLGF